LIVGIGMDLVEISRIEQMIIKDKGNSLQKLLTEDERKQMMEFQNDHRKAEWVAGRFAAKEAVLKAFGTGLGGIIRLRDIEILADRSGKPTVTLSPDAGQLVNDPFRYHLSITHTATTAGAMIVIEQDTIQS
jgi:holo-[acyl-carrier protein] synthase